MNSAIVDTFVNIWEHTLKIIYDSLSYRVFSMISAFLKRVVRNSVIFGFFLKPTDHDNTEHKGSRLPKLFSGMGNAVKSGMTAIGKRLGIVIKASRILRNLYDFYANILFQPLRTFSIIAAVAAISYIILTEVLSSIGIISIIAATALLVTAGFMYFSDTDIYAILSNSTIVKFVLGKSRSLERLGLKDGRKEDSHHVIAVILGLIIAILPVLLPTSYAIGGIAAVFIVPVVIIWPVVGLMGLAFSIAFIPTMLAAGLIILIWIGVISNCSVGKLICKGAFLKGKAALVYMIITILGGIISFAIADSIMIAIIYMIFISVVFLFIILVKNILSLKAILFFAAISALGTAFIGLYQYLTGNIEVGWIDSEMFEGMVRIYSTFENPNVYGEYLLFMIPLSLVLFFSTKRIMYKALWMGAGLLMVAAMMLTMSRGCWIGLAAGVFIYFAIADRRFLWLFLGAAVLMPFVLPESIMTRLLSIGNLEDSSSLYRLYIWLGTFSMLKDYWLTGVGLGTKAFSGIYSAYAYNGIIAPHPHNLYLNIMSELGITGLLGFVWVALTGLRNSISTAFSKSGFNRLIGAGMAAAFTGFVVQGIFDNVFYNYRIVLVFWIFIAFSYSFAMINKKAVFDE